MASPMGNTDKALWVCAYQPNKAVIVLYTHLNIICMRYYAFIAASIKLLDGIV